MINKVVLYGFLARDIELKHTQGGLAIGKGAISVTKKIKDREPETSFFEFVCFGRWAEIGAESKKGDKAIIEGELKQERWEKEGQKHSRIVVVATQIYTHKWERHVGSDAKTPCNPAENVDTHAGLSSEEIPF